MALNVTWVGITSNLILKQLILLLTCTLVSVQFGRVVITQNLIICVLKCLVITKALRRASNIIEIFVKLRHCFVGSVIEKLYF